MIPIDEQIVWAKALIGCNSGIAPSVLASLERLKAIESVQVPKPTGLQINGDYYINVECYDTLRDLLKRIVMEELK
jgi:hypothetical protein